MQKWGRGAFITEEAEVRKLRQTIVDLTEKFNTPVNTDKLNEYLGNAENVDDLKINFEDDTVMILFSHNTERVKGTLRISADITRVVVLGANGEELDITKPARERS